MERSDKEALPASDFSCGIQHGMGAFHLVHEGYDDKMDMTALILFVRTEAEHQPCALDVHGFVYD